METICINCPMGCKLKVEKDKDGNITVTGNGCIRGITYGKEEMTAPKRVVTSLIKGENYLYSVKTSNAIPKCKIFDMLKCISEESCLNDNNKIGDVLIENALGECDIVVTGKTSLNK